ncbi:hypothetical protein ACFFX0_13555 [Citricoccus parietis]|uniref:Uncharacterized protein n=1 Tax=Citricoccus parietis TaxID=592307 RepID=A0ABV5FZR6_9MICC
MGWRSRISPRVVHGRRGPICRAWTSPRSSSSRSGGAMYMISPSGCLGADFQRFGSK